MKGTKILLALLLVTVLMLCGLPSGSLAAEGGVTATLTGQYYEVGENGKIRDEDTGTNDPEITIADEDSGAYIKMSKSAKATGNANEFQITLNVETVEIMEEWPVQDDVNVVLVFDVSDSMDNMVNLDGQGEYIKPGDDGWELSGTRWTALKETAKSFIAKLLENEHNQVSIVVYGGIAYGEVNKPFATTVHQTICLWTSNAEEAINTFDSYSFVGQYNAGQAGSKEISLRNDIFKDNGFSYGETNCQAGFRGAIAQLDLLGELDDNDQFVIYMSDGVPNRCYDSNTTLLNSTSAAAIAEAAKLKDKYEDCTLYTVGFGDEAASSRVLQKKDAGDPEDTNNPYVDKYYYAEDASGLSSIYEAILIQVYKLSQAWTVIDPLPDYVTLDWKTVEVNPKTSSPDPCSLKLGNIIVWNLAQCEPNEKLEGDDNQTIYRYTLSYIITVDADKLDEDVIYPTNKHTTLTYLFTDSEQEPGEQKTADFLVPAFEVTKTPSGSITKVTAASAVKVGDTYTYTITAANASGAAAAWKNVVATDELPACLDYVSYRVVDSAGEDITAASTVTVGEADGIVTISYGDIGIGETAVVEITVKVNSAAKVGERIINPVVAKSANDGDKTAADNTPVVADQSGTVDPPVNPGATGPQGSITKTTSASIVQVGGSYTYTITAANAGSATAAWLDVVVTDTLPDCLDYVSASAPSGVSVSASGRAVTIAFGDISPGRSVSVDITVEVNSAANAGEKIKNSVVAKSSNDTPKTGTDNTPEVPGTTTPDGSGTPNGSISKATATSQVQVGGSYTYTVIAANASSATAVWKSVVATDELPECLNYVGYKVVNSAGNDITAASSIKVTETGGTVKISYGDIAIGGTAMVEITVAVNSKATDGDTITNSVVARSSNDKNKTAADDTPVVGDPSTITYTVTYDANGGTGSYKVTGISPGSAHKVLSRAATGISRSNYTFLGWNTAASGSGTAYSAGDTITVNKNITLYAQWSANSDSGDSGGSTTSYYYVVYDPNGGTGSDYRVTEQTGSSHTVLPNSNRNLGYTRSGYTFLGWSKNSSAANATYTGTGSETVKGSAGETITLYAVWSKQGYNVPGGVTGSTGGTSLIAIGDMAVPLGTLDMSNHFAYIIGYQDGTVKPQGNITRAEVATIFFRLLTRASRAEIWSKSNSFSDVAAEKWYNNAISTLTNGNLLNGYPDGAFRPNASITRAELATIAVKFASAQQVTDAGGTTVFSDISGHWAESNIALAAALGYVNGYGDGTFRPNAPITRAEVATLLNNVLNRHVESESDLLSDMITWPDNKLGNWYYFAVQEATNSHYYDRKTDGKNEVWTSMRPKPDWVALEKPYSQPDDVVY